MKEEERYDLAQSIHRYIRGIANETDIKRIEEWKYSSGENIRLLERISSNDFLSEVVAERREFDAQKGYTRFLKRKRNASLRRMARNIAAITIPLLAIGTLLFLPQERKKTHHPADNAVILTLSDHQQITLHDGSVDELTDHGAVFKNYGEFINYAEATSPASISPTENIEPIYHTLTVPAGKEYTIVLTDGSSVKLNAKSKLKYPVPFASDKREVIMTGEAYFSVSPDSDKPFIVKTPNYDIRVTGTEFNVRSYLENETSTTLVCGSVQIEKNDKTYVLTPGQQALMTTDGITVNEVQVERYIAWAHGEFLFSHEPLSNILSEIAEWYGLDEVIFEDKGVGELLFSAGFRRTTPIEDILEILQSTGVVKFKLSNDKLKVIYK